jgi:hypothetical protein
MESCHVYSSSLTPSSFVPIGTTIIEQLTTNCRECLVQQDAFLAIRRHSQSVFYCCYFYALVSNGYVAFNCMHCNY